MAIPSQAGSEVDTSPIKSHLGLACSGLAAASVAALGAMIPFSTPQAVVVTAILGLCLSAVGLILDLIINHHRGVAFGVGLGGALLAAIALAGGINSQRQREDVEIRPTPSLFTTGD